MPKSDSMVYVIFFPALLSLISSFNVITTGSEVETNPKTESPVPSLYESLNFEFEYTQVLSFLVKFNF